MTRGTGAALGLLGAAGYLSHIGLPIGLHAAARRSASRDDARRTVPGPAAPATDAPTVIDLTDPFLDVRVVIPAHREAGALRTTLPQLHAAGIRPDSVLVVVDGDEETRDVALELGAQVDFSPRRRGKSGALNDAMARCADAGAVICMDANVSVTRESLLAVIRPVLAGHAAVASGVKKERGSTGEGLYWKFESRLMEYENALGGSLAVVGELMAIAPDRYRPVPPLGVNDDQWIAVDTALRGHRVVVVHDAVALEDAAPAAEQRERRARISAGVLRLLWARRRELAASRSTPVRLFLLHKGWRMTVGPAAQTALVVTCAARSRTSWTARLVLAGHVAGVAAQLLPLPEGAPRVVRLPWALLGQAVGMPIVTAGAGLVRVIRDPHGDPRWRTVER